VIRRDQARMPSRGVLREDSDPQSQIATATRAPDAACLSVLNDAFLQGAPAPRSPNEARKASGLPALRRDY